MFVSRVPQTQHMDGMSVCMQQGVQVLLLPMQASFGYIWAAIQAWWRHDGRCYEYVGSSDPLPAATCSAVVDDMIVSVLPTRLWASPCVVVLGRLRGHGAGNACSHGKRHERLLARGGSLSRACSIPSPKHDPLVSLSDRVVARAVRD